MKGGAVAQIKMDDRITRLGYGCSALMGRTGRAQSLRLLHVAYDAGIRHFDVAPMYGYGEAEDCLGEFLAGHRHEVTVTTKFGIAPQTRSPFAAVRQFARRVHKRFPYMKRIGHHGQPSSASPTSTLSFTSANARHALESSLRQLRTEHINVWLLHEADEHALCDETLLRFLEDSVHSGKVGSFGVGSGREAIGGLLATRKDYCRVLQFEWSVFNPLQPATEQFRVHHRALTEQFDERHTELVSDVSRCALWSKLVDLNLRQRSTMAALMLKASLECNPESLILFSSGEPKHIRENVRVSRDESLKNPSMLLQTLIQEHLSDSPD